MRNWVFIGRSLEDLFKRDFLRGLLKLKYVFVVLYEASSGLYASLIKYLKEESPHSIYIYDIGDIIRAEYPPKTKFFPEDSENPWISLRLGKAMIPKEIKIAEGLVYSDRVIMAFTSTANKNIFLEDIDRYLFKSDEEVSREELKIVSAFYRPDLAIAELKLDEDVFYIASNNREILSFFEAVAYKSVGTISKRLEKIIEEYKGIDLAELDILGDEDLINWIKDAIRTILGIGL
ncbi:MAG TPA: hypothetical protein ENK81_03645 [Euryarchaeota archaeon]|nr:hypothetical protein [Euryarchaeota archaeon]